MTVRKIRKKHKICAKKEKNLFENSLYKQSLTKGVSRAMCIYAGFLYGVVPSNTNN